MRTSTAITIAVLGLWLGYSGAESISPIRKSIMLAGDPALNEYRLGAPFIFAGSDSALVGGKLLLRNLDYVIDYNQGTIYLASPLARGDTLNVIYSALPLQIPPHRQHLQLFPDTFGLIPLPASGRPAGSDSLSQWLQARDGQLRFGGSKSVGISLGSGRDLSLDQSLNVRVNGRLGEDLEVNALLSDQGMPVSGSTQELSQIDKIFIRANSSNWSAVVGDYDLSYHRQQLLNVQRQLQGLDAAFSYRSNSLGFSVSSAKGKPGYVRFSGRDGIQGPYQLTVPEGSNFFRVLANSDRIWLDGTLLQRGSDRDYTLDYDRGQILFTPRRMITDDSRITAEFEYSLESFSRNLYFVSSDLYAGKNLLISSAYYQESDDPKQPSAGEMNDVWRSVLTEAGDDTTKLWGDGGSLADSGTGDYDKPDSVYLYAGRGLGQYAVSFTWMGSGKGDYLYDSVLGAFVYAGQGKGDYAALKRYPRPEEFRSLGLQLNTLWEGGRLAVNGARTWKDLNTLSAQDDGDNAGDGGRYDLLWRRDTLGWGGFEVSGRGISYGSDFRPELGLAEGDFESRWGLGGWTGLKKNDPLEGQRSQEYKAGYWPAGYLKVGGGWGRLNLRDGLWLRKYQGSTSFKPWPALSVSYDYRKTLLGRAWIDSLLSSAGRQEHRTEADLSRGIVSYQAGGSNTLDDIHYHSGASSGGRIMEGFLGFACRPKKLDWGSRYSRREDLSRDSLGQVWQGTSHTDQVSSFLKYGAGGSLALSLDHTYRSKVLRPNSPGQGQKSNLGLLRVDHSAWQQSLRTGLDYSLNATEARLLKEVYVKVPDRAGDYSYDSLSGAYYPDTAGNYLKQILEEGPSSRASEISARSYLQFNPGQYFSPAWWTGFRLDLAALSAVKSLRKLNPALLATLPSLESHPRDISGSMELSGDVGYYAGGGWNTRLLYRWRRDRDNQTLSAATVRRSNQRKAELGYPLNDRTRLSFFFSSNITEAYNELVGLESSVRLDFTGTDILHSLSRQLDLNARLEAGRERTQRYNLAVPVTNFQHWSLSPGLSRKLSLSGQLRLEAGATYRKADQFWENIPPEFRYTRPLDWTKTWRATYDYRMNSYFTISASYDGRKESGSRTSHNGRMEVRAYF
ncbi:MAG: hypothetical protein RDU76_06530 [Candidatus Edwardsbacteria bacterium]|nr:hypothetical protein [Candidatus Edwardsbacteria bacterium]